MRRAIVICSEPDCNRETYHKKLCLYHFVIMNEKATPPPKMKTYAKKLNFPVVFVCENSKDVFLVKKMETHLKLVMREQQKVFNQLRKLSEEELERYFKPKMANNKGKIGVDKPVDSGKIIK